MAYPYPIWHEVEACNYKSSKSFGSLNTSQTTINVGTSAKNSEFLVRHVTTRREDGPYTVFTFGVDTGDGLTPLVTKVMNTKTREWYDTDPRT